MKVAYLGPAGTYSNEAACKVYREHTPVYVESLPDIIDIVAKGDAHCGILPIENSTNGPVMQSVDALIDPGFHDQFRIACDVKVYVKLQLYSSCKDLNSIKTVYSHPQVWGQVRNWLKATLPGVNTINCDSTAKAVQVAMADPKGAALAGSLTSKAAPLVSDCSDDPSNSTRFLILLPQIESREKSFSTASSSNLELYTYGVIHDVELDDLIRSIDGKVKLLVPRPSMKPWIFSYYIEIQGSILHPNWKVLGVKEPMTVLNGQI